MKTRVPSNSDKKKVLERALKEATRKEKVGWSLYTTYASTLNQNDPQQKAQIESLYNAWEHASNEVSAIANELSKL